MKRCIFVFLVGWAFVVTALVSIRFDGPGGWAVELGHLAYADITVTKARIGCLPIQEDGNLTGLVAQACNGRASCSYKAPTEDAYKRAGVRAATRSFCTQGMEIVYHCGSGPSETVSVPGDAWNHPPAELHCNAAPAPAPAPAPAAAPAPAPFIKMPASGGIDVTKARIGCLDIQKDGNLTALVQQACDHRNSCSYKAPTEDQYKRAGVRAATRTFCTQAMEITYQCPGNETRVATVPGDAWNHPPAQLTCPPTTFATSWRARNGFSFTNSGTLATALGGWNLGEITSSDVFGGGALAAQMIFDPMTDLVAAEYLALVNSLPPDGLCFGFSVGALRFARGDRSLTPDNNLKSDPSWDGFNDVSGRGESGVNGPTQDLPSSAWSIRGPSVGNSGPASNEDIARYVHRMQLLLGSSETITAFLEDESAGKNANQLLSQVNLAIASGGVIVMHSGTEGHAVVPLGVTNTQGGYTILVYNPDDPYAAGQVDPGLYDTITVDSIRNTFSFDFPNYGGSYGGALSGINVIPYALLRNATLPYAYAAAANLGGGGLLLAVGSSTAGVTQISDSKGRNLLNADGTQNTNPATKIPRGAEFPSNWDRRSSAKHARLFVLDPKERYTHTVTGTAAGNYTLSAFGPGFGVSFHASSAPGEQDTVVVDKSGATPSAEFRTTAARKDIEAHVSIVAADRSSRQVKVKGAGASGSPVKIGFDPTGDTVTFQHGGPAANLAITLVSRTAGGGAGPTFPVANVAVRTGDVVTLKPNWKAAGAGSLHIKSVDGTERTNGL